MDAEYNMEEFYKTAIQKHRQIVERKLNVDKFKKYLTPKSYPRSAFAAVQGKKLDARAVLEKLLQKHELTWEEKYNILLGGLKYTQQHELYDLLEAEKVKEDKAESKEENKTAAAGLPLTVPIDDETIQVSQINKGEVTTGDDTGPRFPSGTTIEIKDCRTGEKIYEVKLANHELFKEIVFDGRTIRFVFKDSGNTKGNKLLEGEKILVKRGELASTMQDINSELGGDVTSVTTGSIYMTIELPLTKLPNISDWLKTGYLCRVLSKALLTAEFKRDFGENVMLDIIDVQADLSKNLFSEKGWVNIISCCDGGYETVRETFKKLISPNATMTFSLQVHMKLCYDGVTEVVDTSKAKAVHTATKNIKAKSTKARRTQSHGSNAAMMPKRRTWRMVTDHLLTSLRRTRSHSYAERCGHESRHTSGTVTTYRPRPDFQLEWFLAVEEGKKDRILHLMTIYPFLLNATNNRKETALLIASANGHTEIVKWLLKEKCEVNKRDHNGATALWRTANLGYKHTARALLKAGADIDTPSFLGYTPLMAAISSKHTDVALFLLLNGCNANRWYKTDSDELTAVHMAAMIGDRNMVKTLIEHKEVYENVTAKWEGVSGYSLLHFACRYGHSELTSYLLIETEADMGALATDNKMPIDIAIENKHWHIYDILISSCKPGYMITSDKPTLTRRNSSSSIDSSVSATFCSSGTSILTIDEPYRMNGLPVGVAVIITNTNFSAESHLSTRLGSSLDKDRLVNSFLRLCLDVHCYEDLTAEEIRDCLQHYSSCDSTEQSCFVCCISSHGKNGFIYGTDGAIVSIISITSMFAAEKAVHLAGKPKMFVVTACQSNNPDKEKRSYSEVVRKEKTVSGKDIIPVSEGDFIVCYSTVPGQTSYRDVTDGTAFVKKLTENLDKYGKTRDIEEILRNTTKHLIQNPIKTILGERKQVALTFTTLQHRFMLRESFYDKSSVLTKSMKRWERKQFLATGNIPTMVKSLSLVGFTTSGHWNQQVHRNTEVYV